MRFLIQEARYFLVAVQFLTRLPAPSFANFETVWLDRSAKYFPLVGALVGALCGIGYFLTAALWPLPLPAIFCVVAGLAITGAFHEDGFADFFDSLGGTTRTARLEIMKDSRVGTFAVVALVALLALKIASLAIIPPAIAVAALITAHSGARFAAVAVIAIMPYAGDVKAAKVKPLAMSVSPATILVAAIFAGLPLLLLPPFTALVALICGVGGGTVIALRARSLLGGYTGDVLGAVEQSFEVAFLLGVAACV